MLTAIQKLTAQSIVNIFETGVVLGDYGSVTVITGDTGHLTFGRSQTTLGSGNLGDLLNQYCANHGARFGPRLSASLNRFANKDLSLDTDGQMQNVLRASADDPVMRATQDMFFDKTYWQPAERAATNLQITSPLGVAVVYDSTVHGSWKLIRDRTTAQSGKPAVLGERAWISAYINTRRQWLATSSRPDLRATVYRMDSLRELVDEGFWGLELPLVVRGAEISMASLTATPPNCYDGPHPGSRPLALQSPLERGLDVRLVQLGLSDQGADIRADGVFGPTSVRRIREFQAAAGLPVTGVADVNLVARLTA